MSILFTTFVKNNLLMEKEFVPYELVVKLKELGFDKPCFGYYHVCDGYTKGYAFCYFNEPERYESDSAVLAPTFSQAFRWFREKHFILYDIVFYREDKRTKKGYWYNIFQWNFDMTKRNIINVNLYFTTYEEAELACLKKLIEIVKNKKL